MKILRQEAGHGFADAQRNPGLGLVTVVISSYNHAPYIRDTVNSVLAQTYPQLEIIFIDDGSTDDSFDIVAGLLRQAARPFLAIRQVNQGLCASVFNNGIGLAHGEFISLLESDDSYFPWKLAKSVAALRASPALLVLGRDVQMLADGTVLPGTATDLTEVQAAYQRGDMLNSLYRFGHRIAFPYLGLLFRREAFDAIGLFEPDIIVEDFDLLMRVAASRVPVTFLPEVLGAHRVFPRSAAHRLKVSQSMEAVLQKRAPSWWQANRALAYVKINQAALLRHISLPRAGWRLLAGALRYPPALFSLLARSWAYLHKPPAERRRIAAEYRQ